MLKGLPGGTASGIHYARQMHGSVHVQLLAAYYLYILTVLNHTAALYMYALQLPLYSHN